MRFTGVSYLRHHSAYSNVRRTPSFVYTAVACRSGFPAISKSVYYSPTFEADPENANKLTAVYGSQNAHGVLSLRYLHSVHIVPVPNFPIGRAASGDASHRRKESAQNFA